MPKRKTVNRTIEAWTYVQAAVPKLARDIIEREAIKRGRSLAELAGNALVDYARLLDSRGWESPSEEKK